MRSSSKWAESHQQRAYKNWVTDYQEASDWKKIDQDQNSCRWKDQWCQVANKTAYF